MSKEGNTMLEKQITLRINDKLYRQIESVAGKNLRKFSDMVRLILTENIDNYRQDENKNSL
jgi:hypothetical protein